MPRAAERNTSGRRLRLSYAAAWIAFVICVSLALVQALAPHAMATTEKIILAESFTATW